MFVKTKVRVWDSCEQVIDASAIVLGHTPVSPEQVAHRQFVREQVGTRQGRHGSFHLPATFPCCCFLTDIDACAHSPSVVHGC